MILMPDYGTIDMPVAPWTFRLRFALPAVRILDQDRNRGDAHSPKL
ncbi:hypothetical protein ACIA3K_24450 [Micromonospora sp. NPDC051543]